MMILIGIWLHSKSSVEQWNAFMDRQMKTVTATGSFVSMFCPQFLSSLREGAGTILLCWDHSTDYNRSFHTRNRACHSRSHHHCSGDDQGQSSHPTSSNLFILTWLIYALAFKMLGVSIHALQLTNILPSHLVNGLPTIDWVGIYPSWEVLLPQLTLCGPDRLYHGETTWQGRADKMTIVEHLVEFRKRLIAVVLCYIIVSHRSLCIWRRTLPSIDG